MLISLGDPVMDSRPLHGGSCSAPSCFMVVSVNVDLGAQCHLLLFTPCRHLTYQLSTLTMAHIGKAPIYETI